MKKYLMPVLFINCLFFSQLFAQQACNDDMIMNVKGKWQKTNDANMKAANQAQAIIRIDKMQKLLQAAYAEPKGIEAEWYRSISGKAIINSGPVPYALNALFLAYYCNTNTKKIEAGGETGTWFYIWANQLNNWFAEYINIYVIQKQPVYLLQKRIGELNGYPLYEGNYNQTSNTGTRYSRAIILSRTGQSPYLPVTQKQFLKAFLNYKEKKFAKALEFQKNRSVKSDEVEEAEKKKHLEMLERNTRPDKLARAKENFLRNYITSSQQKEKWIADMTKNHEEYMRPARGLLTDSLKPELQQPAILDYSNILEFTEFSTEEKGGRQLVRLNPDYFNMTLPGHVSQLLIVHWSWDVKIPGNYWRTQIEKNFDFDALKAMLDK